MVLESRYYTRRVVQRYSRSLRHNSREFPTGCCWAPIPQKAAEEILEAWYYTRHWYRGGPRGLVLPDTGVGVVLGAWCYTRAAGTEVIHVAATGFQGIPDCVARYKFPQNMATTRSIPTAARGVDTEGLRHLYQGSVVDGSNWNTGAQSSHGVINLHFVYTLSLSLSLFINFATV